MACVVCHRHVLLDLPCHIPTEVHVSQNGVGRAQVKDDRAGQFVMRDPTSINGFENVN